MVRSSRPLMRLVTAAALLTAGTAPVLVVSGLNPSPASASVSTDCTVAAPPTVGGAVQVSTPGQLRWLASNTVSLSATIEQQNDLDLINCGNWPGIGGGATNPFTGTYDGNGRTISNVSISATTSYWGLFRNTNGATISALNLVGVNVSVTGSRSYIGGLVGYALNSAVENISVSGSVTGYEAVGGLIGYAEADSGARSSIASVTSSAAATGDVNVGGLIGWADGDMGQITVGSARATGNVLTRDTSAGGLIGYVEVDRGTVTISSSHAAGAVTGWRRVGGLVGSVEVYGASTSAFFVSHVSASGNVTVTGTTPSAAGGLIGDMGYYSNGLQGTVGIEHATASGDVVATGLQSSDLGGLIGLIAPWRKAATNITIHDAHATGDVGTSNPNSTVADRFGGLIGSIAHWSFPNPGTSFVSATMSAVSASGAVTGRQIIGGLVGTAYASNASLTIDDARFTGANASVSGGGDTVGGLIAYMDADGSAASIAMRSVTVSAAVTGSDDEVGGLVAFVDVDNNATVSISNAAVTSSVSGSDDDLGGLIGYASNQTGGTLRISSASVIGNVTGAASSERVGGLIGYAHGDSGTLSVEQSRASGRVSGNAETGGLLGHARVSTGTLSVSRSFATGDVGHIGQVNTQEFGGLVALIEVTGAGSVTLDDVYATGAVSAGSGSKTGGLVGEVMRSSPAGSIRIARSHAVGEVNGGVTGTDVGGLIGKASTGTTVSASFWDTTTTKQSTSAGGAGAVGNATGAMRNALTFSAAGWLISNGVADPSKTWAVCSSLGYPFLMWQTDLVAALPGVPACPTDGSIGGGGGVVSGGSVSLPPSVGGLVTQPVPTTTTTIPPTTTVAPSTTVAPTDDTPIPVPFDGVLPELPAGDVVVHEDGEPVAVEVFVENDTELVLQSTRFELRLQGDCATSACTIDTTPEGREVLTLQENGKANTQGEGFQPGSTVHVWLFSEPRYLGQLTVNADGTFEGDVNLGDIAVGEHTLQVNGTSQTGAERSANLGVIVNPQAVPTPGTGVLPATGTSTTPIWLVALALLGLGLVATTRRRNT